MIKLKSLIPETNEEYQFVGFHRQRSERSKYDDVFITGNNYGKGYFREILDSLHNKDRSEAMELGYTDFDWQNEYSNEYDKMEEIVAEWLNDKGYRWIFITENRPIGVTVYGNHIYKIYFKQKDILNIIDDPYGADDVAYAYLYHIKNPPLTKEYDQT